MAASIVAASGAAMDLEVESFLTSCGLAAFRKGDSKENTRITARGKMSVADMKCKVAV